MKKERVGKEVKATEHGEAKDGEVEDGEGKEVGADKRRGWGGN